MKCANPECRKKKPTRFFSKIMRGEGVVIENKWYCDEHCFRHPILKDYLLRKHGKRELRTSTHPITAHAFGAALLKQEKITRDDLEQALHEKKKNGQQPIAHYLMKRGLINRKDVLEALGRHHKVPVSYIGNRELEPALLELVPGEIARISRVLPLDYNKQTNKLSLLMQDPTDLTTRLAIKKLVGVEVQPFQGDPVEIKRYLDYYYPDVELTFVKNIDPRIVERLAYA